jgi:hypothetical protein
MIFKLQYTQIDTTKNAACHNSLLDREGGILGDYLWCRPLMIIRPARGGGINNFVQNP